MNAQQFGRQRSTDRPTPTTIGPRPAMSALGQKQTFAVQNVMSAQPPKATSRAPDNRPDVLGETNRCARMFVSLERCPLEACDADSHVCKSKSLRILDRGLSAGVATSSSPPDEEAQPSRRRTLIQIQNRDPPGASTREPQNRKTASRRSLQISNSGASIRQPALNVRRQHLALHCQR